MSSFRHVLVVGLVALLPGCGSQEDKSASPQKPAVATGKKADSDKGLQTPTTPAGVKPAPIPESRVDPPAVDPPNMDLPSGDPPRIDPPSRPPQPVPAVEPPAEKTPPELKPSPGGAAEKPSGTVEDVPSPSGGRAIQLKLADADKTMSAAVGDLVIVELEANPTTGFGWEAAAAAKDSVLVLKSKQYLSLAQLNPEIAPLAGQGGVTTFTYQVVGTGKGTISLSYRRPWEKDVEPAKKFSATIEATRQTSPVVTGKILFSAEPELEKISRIEVSIRNTALADGPSPLIGQVELKPPFQLPVTFAVPYDPAKIQPNPMFYSISARVLTVVDGSEKLYYINDTAHHVFRQPGDTKCDVAVKKLR